MNVIQIKHNRLRIPTGGRLTSWLFTRRGGVEFEATEDKSIQWQGKRFEPGTSGLQIQRPTTRPRFLPYTSFFKAHQHMLIKWPGILKLPIHLNNLNAPTYSRNFSPP